MANRILLFTQPGCLSCELIKIYLEARQLTFEERDISQDAEARREMLDDMESNETPTLALITEQTVEIVVGFDPVRLDQLLDSDPSSDSVTAS